MLNKTLMAAIAAVMLGSVGTTFAATNASEATVKSTTVVKKKAHKVVAHKAHKPAVHKTVRHTAKAKAGTHTVAMHEPASVQTREERMREARAKWERSRKL